MRLDTYLSEHGITEAAFAERIGVNQSSVNRMRKGLIRPDIATLSRIVEATEGKVTLEDFLAEPPPRPFASRGADAA
jgi:transcriptional regulator with XRE-family HTH domain